MVAVNGIDLPGESEQGWEDAARSRPLSLLATFDRAPAPTPGQSSSGNPQYRGGSAQGSVHGEIWNNGQSGPA